MPRSKKPQPVQVSADELGETSGSAGGSTSLAGDNGGLVVASSGSTGGMTTDASNAGMPFAQQMQLIRLQADLAQSRQRELELQLQLAQTQRDQRPAHPDRGDGPRFDEHKASAVLSVLPTLRPHTLRAQHFAPPHFAPPHFAPHTLRPHNLHPNTLRPHTLRPNLLRPHTLHPHTLRPTLCAPTPCVLINAAICLYDISK